MKKNKFVLAMLVAMSGLVSSCVTEDDAVAKKPWEIDVPIVDYDPGQIPGLGSTDGDPTGVPYELPPGFELGGTITGFDGNITRGLNNGNKVKSGNLPIQVLLTRNDAANRIAVGSGAEYVRLLLKLKNTLNQKNTIVFPAGLVVKSRSGDYQNGLLIKKTKKVVFQPDEEKEIILDMYCANAHKSSSSNSEEYDIFVISDASPVWDLIHFVADRVINWEELSLYVKEDFARLDNDLSYFGSLLELYHSYYAEIGNMLQNIVWQITDDGILLNEENKIQILEKTIKVK